MEKPSTMLSPSLSDLPADELAAYARELGLSVDDASPRGELVRIIRDRQELLVELDREAMLDIVVWTRMPVRQSASKEELAKHIATIKKVRFDGLSDRGLHTLARIRGVRFHGGDRRVIEQALRKEEGLWARLERTRRSVVGSLISKLVEGSDPEGEYRFLPENDEGLSLKESIEDVGVVGGIAQKLRGAADTYIHEKLDEIERRIDRKLDVIDQRLAEWRDQEIRNRLRIIKITLITAIVVAIFSLGYEYLKSRTAAPAGPLQSVVGAEERGPIE